MVVDLADIIPIGFKPVVQATWNPQILNIACKGGRGSGKSSNIAFIISRLIIQYPVNAVCIRKTDNTLEQSVYEQIKWAISEQGLERYFKFNKSPLRITYIPRGNYIVFRGAQNPERIKSLKDSRFPFAIGWIEELAEFKTEDEVKTITNSLLRGELGDGLFYKFFYTYNPPKRKQSWVNKKYESQFQPSNTFVHASTYKDNPFIAKEFIAEAEATRERSERRYRWEYLGEAIGSGVVPFDNLRFERITDEQVADFDNIRNGIDYGYATDPLAFVRWHYDKKKNGIYAIDAKGDAYISGKLFVNNTEVKPSFDKTEILNMVYPVGAIYMSTSSANPSTFIGGTWQRYAQGRTIVGVSENETEFNYVGKTGGAKTHTLTNEEMPSHSHGDKTISSGGRPISSNAGWDNTNVGLYKSTDYNQINAFNKSSGGDQPHNNLQPYITTYIWLRTA